MRSSSPPPARCSRPIAAEFVTRTHSRMAPVDAAAVSDEEVDRLVNGVCAGDKERAVALALTVLRRALEQGEQCMRARAIRSREPSLSSEGAVRALHLSAIAAREASARARAHTQGTYCFTRALAFSGSIPDIAFVASRLRASKGATRGRGGVDGIEIPARTHACTHARTHVRDPCLCVCRARVQVRMCVSMCVRAGILTPSGYVCRGKRRGSFAEHPRHESPRALHATPSYIVIASVRRL
jgi:hypothetical protein